jgi:hypothetical protein
MGLPERAEPLGPPERSEPAGPRERVERIGPPGSAERSGRLRQSMADLEHAFSREISLERRRRDSLRRTAEQRTFKREVQRRHKRGSMRFALLVLTLVFTAAIVTVVMFRTLYLLLS